MSPTTTENSPESVIFHAKTGCASPKGTEYFNPDEATKRILSVNHDIPLESANNIEAWHQAKRLLERTIGERLNFAFETTLGGQTITRLLETALEQKIEVRIWYVGLSTPELHIARVRSRVEKGGHSIPVTKIRERYHNSRLNLIRLMPRLTALRVYANSEEADPDAGMAPEPKLILHLDKAKIVSHCDLGDVPEWAKPIAFEALKLSGSG